MVQAHTHRCAARSIGRRVCGVVWGMLVLWRAGLPARTALNPQAGGGGRSRRRRRPAAVGVGGVGAELACAAASSAGGGLRLRKGVVGAALPEAGHGPCTDEWRPVMLARLVGSYCAKTVQEPKGDTSGDLA